MAAVSANKGPDETGAKLAARIAGVVGLTLVSLLGIGESAADGAGLVTLALMAYRLMLLTPVVALSALAMYGISWLRRSRTRHVS